MAEAGEEAVQQGDQEEEKLEALAKIKKDEADDKDIDMDESEQIESTVK